MLLPIAGASEALTLTSLRPSRFDLPDNCCQARGIGVKHKALIASAARQNLLEQRSLYRAYGSHCILSKQYEGVHVEFNSFLPGEAPAIAEFCLKAPRGSPR